MLGSRPSPGAALRSAPCPPWRYGHPVSIMHSIRSLPYRKHRVSWPALMQMPICHGRMYTLLLSLGDKQATFHCFRPAFIEHHGADKKKCGVLFFLRFFSSTRCQSCPVPAG